ncbi:hypothetical protein ACFWUQ_24015 [Streptomyces sp. NPDC058662]|uniref:hypothetical protein n=1 Tax=Streptomyces sp. NPDC058662 TaxID=3346583 RepID=UPI003658690B
MHVMERGTGLEVVRVDEATVKVMPRQIRIPGGDEVRVDVLVTLARPKEVRTGRQG